MDEALAGIIIAIIAELPQLLEEAKDHQPETNDQHVNANILLNNEWNEVALHKQNFIKAEQLTREVQQR